MPVLSLPAGTFESEDGGPIGLIVTGNHPDLDYSHNALISVCERFLHMAGLMCLFHCTL